MVWVRRQTCKPIIVDPGVRGTDLNPPTRPPQPALSFSGSRTFNAQIQVPNHPLPDLLSAELRQAIFSEGTSFGKAPPQKTQKEKGQQQRKYRNL